MMSNQNWDPGAYAKNAAFVPALGKPVIDLLEPKIGEKILDLGCGTGAMARELIDAGFDVVGVDASEEMVSAARANGVDAKVEDATALERDGEFDAIFSNAVLHWIADQYAVVRGVWRALKPGGRFAAECGGEGCNRIIREGIKSAAAKRDIDYRRLNPWTFPEVGMYTKILETQGFAVKYIARIDRPTHLPNGLSSWLETFARAFTVGMTDEEKAGFFEDVEKYCRPRLCDEERGWTADYVRLRFLAVKPEDL